jgi:ABC-type sugar transport system substrate-binding protein
MNRRTLAVTLLGLVLIVGVPAAMASASAPPLKKGLKVFVIPKNLGNPYFTTADSVKSGGALFALKQLGESGTETSGTAATAASQIPAIQAAITKGANALVVSASDAAALCPTLKAAMKKKITVVTYDSDAPACRSLFINQADSGGDRSERGRPAREAARRQGRDRDPVGRRIGDEPERLDRLHEAGAEEVPEHEARCGRVRQ